MTHIVIYWVMWFYRFVIFYCKLLHSKKFCNKKYIFFEIFVFNLMSVKDICIANIEKVLCETNLTLLFFVGIEAHNIYQNASNERFTFHCHTCKMTLKKLYKSRTLKKLYKSKMLKYMMQSKLWRSFCNYLLLLQPSNQTYFFFSILHDKKIYIYHIPSGDIQSSATSIFTIFWVDSTHAPPNIDAKYGLCAKNILCKQYCLLKIVIVMSEFSPSKNNFW